MKKRLLILLLLFTTLIGYAQLQSPDQFLGYKLGSHYTPHFKIVNYVKYIAAQLPENVKLEQYGETNEGRPLLLAFIASKENLSNLDNIRKNNMRLANSLPDKMAQTEETPVIVWLSYNVHGNEPSSSEAAMLTLYELANPTNTRSANWLKNTVIVLDPCINPDGRDRYVNWENQMQGKTPNANPVAREHIEPWPGGRTNHYNFDLNRDWAWQTQIETQQRLAKFNQWLPQVHVDFHEQWYNSPYYFAPAAEPFHEVITPWQREFQTIIGRNNAKYFDANGWLYFTRERFDLFYPSYGDTYPTYNGSIGMTFEQGGHSRGGLSVAKQDGDTLTLYDRLIHHYTTGMSTVEMASANASKLVKEFRKYFNAAVQTPVGDFKSYVLAYDGTDRIERLKTLLTRNNIDWGYAGASNLNGFNYQSGKLEPFKTAPGDIVINCNQPKSNLVKVLFERNSKITDSATYDITAWSVPFVYGVKAYGLKEFVTGTSKTNPLTAQVPSASAENTYAWVVKWNGLNSAVFLSALLNKGIRVRYAEEPFKVGNSDFDKGALIVTRASNFNYGKELEAMVKTAAEASALQVAAVPTGFVDKGFDIGSGRVKFINKPKVALLAGKEVSSNAMGEIWHFFDQQLNYPITLINSDDLGNLQPGDINTIIIPDGYYTLFTQKEKNEQLKDWVRKGGKVIALENAAIQMSNADWGFKIKATDDDKKDKDDKEDKKNDYTLLKKYDNRERDEITNNIAGAIFRVEMDNTHPLAFGYGDSYYTLKQDQTIYEFLKEGWNVGVIKKDNYVSGFTGVKLKDKLRDGTLFGAIEMGRGNVIFMADDPVFRSFWENGKLLLCNAVFMVGQ